ncbi:MAG: hypothetical protein IT388_12200 [Nitrospirales bacterium]|nr:hypothetical protein [Nitrospirales bacterium]
MKEAKRNQTALLLLMVSVLQWGAEEMLGTFSFLAGFVGFSLLLGHVVSKELFSKYGWDVGERLNAAWKDRELSHALLAIGVLIARVGVYSAVMGAMVASLFFIRGGAQ